MNSLYKRLGNTFSAGTMTQVFRFLLLITFSFLLIFEPGVAEPNQAEADTSDLKVGLVLSGGGAKGIAHIGLLSVLEEAGVRVDYVTGTSMGSVVGGLYAIGHTTEDLTKLALSTDWEEMFTDRPNRRHLSMFEKEVDERFIASFPISERGINLPPGLVAGQNIAMWMARHTWTVHGIEDFANFRIPFATVATDLETGDAVIFKEGFLPDAIRASIALPSLLTPYEIDGQILIDGGLIRNLPVIEALEMGADYIIAVDVSNPLRDAGDLKSIPSILTQAVYFRVIEHVNQQKELADYVIDVSELDEFAVTDFDETERFLQIGEESARKHFEKFQEIAAMQNHSNTLPPANTDRKEIQINSVSVSGNEFVPADFIITELGFTHGDFVTADLIEEAITRLYSTRLFNLITYRFMKTDTGEEGQHLRFRVIENTDDSFRVGVRYESETQASIKLHASFRNLLQRGSNLRFDLRLGRDTEFQTEYLYFGGIRSRLGLRTRFQYKGEQIDYYDGDNRISSLKNHLVSADFFSGTFLSNTTLAGLGFRKDFVRFTREINPDLIPFSQRDYHAFYAKIWIDSMNRRSYPTRGHKLLLRSTFSDPLFFSPVSFNEQTFFWKAVYPITPDISIQHTLHLGRTFGDDLPWSYWHSPNRRDAMLGMTRFGGYDRYELTGRNIQLFSAGLQFEVARHRFIKLDAYLGNVFDEFQFNPIDNRYRSGYSISAGALTVLGPLEAIFSGSPRNPFLFELQIGYEF